MSLFIRKSLSVLPVLFLLIFTSQLAADEQGHGTSHKTRDCNLTIHYQGATLLIPG